ncbi:hypothetical protein ILUMI_24491 [Ignelater luminosus]|uniref:Uncharacterized protein n=1 Tax=Ignelater luminosus TaxID=2038154 RepID=A0A8K0C6X7_IGNLU|nr:hypothetical protein ILUMI_24491 [Ignelater luminosus]
MERQEEMFEEIRNNQKSVNNKLDKLIEEMQAIKAENTTMKIQLSKQEKRINFLERKVRKKILIIKGVLEENNENEEQTKKIVAKISEEIGVGRTYKEELKPIDQRRPAQEDTGREKEASGKNEEGQAKRAQSIHRVRQINNEKRIVEWWREYFQELLASEGEEEQPEETSQNTDAVNDEDDKTITMEELTKSLQKLKVGKAPGHDEITA